MAMIHMIWYSSCFYITSWRVEVAQILLHSWNSSLYALWAVISPLLHPYSSSLQNFKLCALDKRLLMEVMTVDNVDNLLSSLEN